MENNNDEKLWRIAKRRAAFKKSLTVYFLVNSFLCAVWYLTIGRHGGTFWPVWSIIGWGLALAFQYSNAYGNNPAVSEEKEYEKLKNRDTHAQ